MSSLEKGGVMSVHEAVALLEEGHKLCKKPYNPEQKAAFLEDLLSEVQSGEIVITVNK